MSHSAWNRFSTALPALLGIGLFALSIWALHQELQQYKLADLLQSLRSIPQTHLLLAIGLTAANYGAIATYDQIAIRYARHPLPYFKTAFAAAISTAVGNSVGFALLSGSAIRYRLYPPWGLSAVQVAQVIAFSSISFWLGLFAVAGVMFTLQPIAIPDLLHLPVQSTQSIGVLFLAIIAAYWLWNIVSHNSIRVGGWTLPHVLPHLVLAQIAVAAADWSLAASVLYALLPTAPAYSTFFGIYLLSQFAGVVSNVPGGLGVFETVMLLLLSRSDLHGNALPTPALFGALIAYRAIYYLLPLAIAILLLGAYELQQRSARKR